MTRVTSQFATLAPLVKGYVERRLFGGRVDFDDPLVLQTLRDPATTATVLEVMRQVIDEATLRDATPVGEPKPLRLSSTRPFLWSGETAPAEKSIFTRQPCDSGFEIRFAGFLDRCPDVVAFAKLAREVRFSLEYRSEGGRLAYYYPDFVLRLDSEEHCVVETKGRADLDVPRKDERATRWAVDATVESRIRWRYHRIDEELFDRHEAQLSAFGALTELIYAARREDYLAAAPPGRRRSREELLVNMARVQEQMRGVTGVDEEIDRFRDDLRE